MKLIKLLLKLIAKKIKEIKVIKKILLSQKSAMQKLFNLFKNKTKTKTII